MSTNDFEKLKSFKHKGSKIELELDETFNVKEFSPSLFVQSKKVLVRGEWDNLNSKTRNSMIFLNKLKNGRFIGIHNLFLHAKFFE